MKIILDDKSDNPLGAKISICECCGKENGILLMGKEQRKLKDPKSRFIRVGSLCKSCEEVLKSGGIWLREASGGNQNQKHTDNSNQWTGRGMLLSPEGARWLISDESILVSAREHGGVLAVHSSEYNKMESIICSLQEDIDKHREEQEKESQG